MKSPWLIFVLMTVLCWGAYVPILHKGQVTLGGGKPAPLRAFLFVGLAYGIMSVLVFLYLKIASAEVWEFNNRGVTLSTIAGILGAVGALGITFAIKNGGSPLLVAPLVFAGAPVVNTIVSMIWHKPKEAINPLFFVGIAMAAAGAFVALKFKPS